jgi:hypothetical protein
VEQRVRKDEPHSVVGFKPCSLALIGFVMMGSFSLLILLLLRENLDECRLASLVSFTGLPRVIRSLNPKLRLRAGARS